MKKRHDQSRLDIVSKFVKRLSFILLVSLVALWSCSDDDIDRTRPIPPTNPEVLDAEVLFEINMPQTMIPSTYALTPTEENYVKSIEILLFDVTTKVFTGKPYYCDKIEEDGGLNSAKKRFSVSLPKGGPYDIVILANSRQMVNDALVPNMSGKTLKNDVLALLEMEHAGKWVSKSTDANYIAIPMWGEIENKKVEENLKFNANLMRMLAKIDVVIGAGAPQAAFKLHAVHLVKANNKGHIVPAPANMAGGVATAPTLPSSVTPSVPLTYLASEETNGERELKNVIYTFEATKAVYGSLPIATCVVLQGSYDGGGIENYYRLDFGSGTGGAPNYLDLIRNFRYDINVTKISGIGQPTLDDAIKNPSTNIIVDLTVWDNADFPIIIFDNTYSMGFSSDDITLSYKASNENRLKVMTDFPDGWKVDKILDSDGVTVTNWLSVTPTSGAVTTATDIKFDVTENTGTAPRVCYIYISAGPLAHKVKVTQETALLLSKIVWDDYDGTNSLGPDDGDTNFTSITIEDSEGNTYTPPTPAVGVIPLPLKISGTITKVTVVYKAYTLVVPVGKYTIDRATETLTIDDRSLIGKPVHLDKVRLGLRDSYIQVSDVNIATDATYANWIPIGTALSPFKGNYDGGSGNSGTGFKIHNLNIDRATEDMIGLYGVASEATFKNINIASGNIKGRHLVGAICGANDGNGTITGCTNAAILTGENSVGGICGYNTSVILKCSNVGAISGASPVGGIVGNNEGSITECTNIATVTGGQYIGGICGQNDAGGITSDCTNEAAISGTSVIGGICGNNIGAESKITNCNNFAGGKITGGSSVAGICGRSTGTITNCQNNAIGAAAVKGTSNTGGICGTSTGTISGCTNNAAVDATGIYIGGICGTSTGTMSSNTNTATVKGGTVGGICGNNSGTISGDLSTGAITTNSVGGNICGSNSGTISGITNTTPIISTVNQIGGISGTNSGTIKDCSNAAIVSGRMSVGGIVGEGLSATGVIINCRNLAGGNVTGTLEYTAGICGYNNGGEITNSTNAAIIKGSVDYTGGICGFNIDGPISGCTNAGSVEGVKTVGGICGESNGAGGKVTNCQNLTGGNVTGTDNKVGGICGNNESGSVITGCSNNATIKGILYVGGIVGWSIGANTKITYCQNLAGGSVIVTGDYVGGICGSNTTPSVILSCTNAATIDGNARVGGIVGQNSSNGAVTAGCINTGAVKGTGTSVGGICGSNFNTGSKISACYNLGAVTGATPSSIVGSGNTPLACYFGGGANNFTSTTGSTKFGSAPGWPADSGDWSTTDPVGYWGDLGGWNGGVPIYPTLR